MSSSKLLEQAIVDAQALRDAAFKSAQATLLEKYAPQIKEAVEQLLEQKPEDENPDANTPSPTDALAGGQSDAATMDMVNPPGSDFGGSPDSPMGKGKVAGTAKELPLGATNGEKLCPCPDDDEQVEIELDLGQMADMLGAGESDEEQEDDMITNSAMTGTSGVEGQPSSPVGLRENDSSAGQMISDESMSEIELEEEVDEQLTEVSLEEVLSEDEEEESEEESEEDEEDSEEDENEEESEEESELSPKQKEIAKAAPPKDKITGADFKALKKTNESKTKQLIKASTELLKEHQTVLKSVEKKDAQIQKLLDENKKFSSIIEEMSDAFKKLEEVNLTNARLFYSNQVLKSASLNERQKNHIVEAVSKADSVNEAKTVYETLINSVGGPAKEERSPKSLNEAISKGSTFRLPHKQAEQPHDPNKDRWLKLAGIK